MFAVLRWLADHYIGTLVVGGSAVLTGALVGQWADFDEPWNYAAAVGAALLVLGAGLAGIERYRRGLPPPWGTAYRPTSDVVTVTDTAMALSYRTDPTPGSTAIAWVHFPLEGRTDYNVQIAPGRLSAIRFIEPFRKTVRRDQLPKTVRWRLREVLVVKRFAPGAIVIDESLSGLSVRVELYYNDEDGG